MKEKTVEEQLKYEKELNAALVKEGQRKQRTIDVLIAAGYLRQDRYLKAQDLVIDLEP